MNKLDALDVMLALLLTRMLISARAVELEASNLVALVSAATSKVTTGTINHLKLLSQNATQSTMI